MKYLTGNEIRELGIVMEVNRRILHPLGLALEYEVPTGDNPAVLRVQDHRDDPEGVYFGDLTAADAERAAALTVAMQERSLARERALGFIVQPLPTREGAQP